MIRNKLCPPPTNSGHIDFGVGPVDVGIGIGVSVGMSRSCLHNIL